jgi:hypothetical protein
MNASCGCYAAHSTLAFALINMKKSKRFFSCAPIGLKQQPGKAPLDLAAVRELKKSDLTQISRLARSINAYAKYITWAPGYW